MEHNIKMLLDKFSQTPYYKKETESKFAKNKNAESTPPLLPSILIPMCRKCLKRSKINNAIHAIRVCNQEVNRWSDRYASLHTN